MKKLGTKILNVVTTFAVTVVFSGLNLFVPLAANAAVCPTLNPGDMIKVSGKPAIYVVNNQTQVQYFPSGYVFKSWRPTYGGYTTVSMACFDSLALPTNPPYGVNFAPGSYVIKRGSSDQLYVVLPGNVKAKITPEAAKALYGNFYQPQVINDEFWPNYTKLGTDITEGKAHPGMVVSNGGKNWYVDVDGKLREVTATGLTANGWQTAFIRPVAASAVAGLALGATIDAEVKTITDKTQSGGVAAPVVVVTPPAPGTPPAATPAGAVSVSLAADNPFAATLVSDSGTNGAQAMVPVLKLDFGADNSGDVKVTSLVLKRTGISADTDISNMYLYDDAGMKLAGNPSVANNLVSFTNSAGMFTVTKGTKKSVKVLLDLKNAVSSGKTFQFSIVDAAGVTSNATGSVGGTFPLTGNIFTSAAVTDLGKLAFTSVSPASNTTVDPGTTGYEIWRFQAVSSNQDIELRKLVFTVVGSVNVGDIKNFSLWDGSKQLGTTVVEMAADKTIMIDLAAAPYLVTKGQTRTLSLKVDVVAGTNRNFRASLQNSSDVITYDKNYNVYLKTNGTDSFAIVQPNTGGTAVNITVNTGTLTQSLSSDSPTGNIALSGTNLTLAKFGWKANGEDIKVSSLYVSSTISSSRTLINVRLLVNGSQVGTTISTLTGNGAANTGWGTFGNSFIIKAGTEAAIKVVADTTGSTALNDTVVVGLSGASSNAQGVVSLNSITTLSQNANTLTIKSGTVTMSLDTSFGNKSSANPNGTINGTGTQVGSFIVTAGAGEAVDLTQITLKDAQSNPTCIGAYMQNLVLKDSAGKQLGTTYPNPSATCSTANSYTFNISPAVKIANGAQYVVRVYADLKAAFTTASTALIQGDAVTATGVDTGGSASVSAQALSLQNNYISTSGAYTVAIDSNTPVAKNLLMGAVDQELARFNITASTTEAINITQLVISNRVSSAATGTVRNIRLYDNDNNLIIGSAIPSFSNSNATGSLVHADFTGLKFQIPKGTSKVVVVKADLTTYDDLGSPAATAQASNLAILKNYTSSQLSIISTGASSGVTISPSIIHTGVNITNVGGDNLVAYGTTSTLYRAKLVTAWSSDTPSGAAGGSASQIVGKFTITNLANSGTYVAIVESVNFDLSTTISNTADRALIVYKDSIATGNILVTTSWLATGNQNFGDTAITGAGFTDVSISSGQAKTFWVTLDTSNAVSTKNLSVRIGASDVAWTDGSTTTGITAMDQDLPLQYKTFTY